MSLPTLRTIARVALLPATALASIALVACGGAGGGTNAGSGGNGGSNGNGGSGGGTITSSNDGNVSYSKDIQPIWDKHCVSCHVQRAIPFDPRAPTSYKFLSSAKRLCAGFVERPFLVPGKPEESILWRALSNSSHECLRAMPPSFDELGETPYPEGGLKVYDPAAFAKVEQWIRQGAQNN